MLPIDLLLDIIPKHIHAKKQICSSNGSRVIMVTDRQSFGGAPSRTCAGTTKINAFSPMWEVMRCLQCFFVMLNCIIYRLVKDIFKIFTFFGSHFDKMADILASPRRNHGAFFSVNIHIEWDHQTKFQLYINFFSFQLFIDWTNFVLLFSII